jgi:hypothetical protein
MRTIKLGLALAAIASPAMAISTQVSTQITCPAIRMLVQREGAVLLRYTSKRPPGLSIYDRVVVDGSKCIGNGTEHRTYFPASDTDSCAVWVCRPGSDLRP